MNSLLSVLIILNCVQFISLLFTLTIQSTASDGRRQSSSASQTVSVERRNFFGEINNLLTAALHHYVS